MQVLALDAATEACSVALLKGRELIVRTAAAGHAGAESLLDMVDAVMAEAAGSLSQLDGIAASVGPGAFTGVRISVSVAQGLAFGAGLPVIPVTTLEALAHKVLKHDVQHALACLDARMGEVYWGGFAADPRRGVIALAALRVGAPAAVRPPLVGPYAGVGRGFAAYPELAALPGLLLDEEDGRALPEALHMARLGALRLGAGEGIDAAQLTPEYVRDRVALTEAERARRHPSGN